MMELVVFNKSLGKEEEFGVHQGVEMEYLCFEFATGECHKRSFAVTLLFSWITIYTAIVNTSKF